jgi:hypothetical protein
MRVAAGARTWSLICPPSISGKKSRPTTLARAVIGGLLFATPTTLLIVPYLFAMLRKRNDGVLNGRSAFRTAIDAGFTRIRQQERQARAKTFRSFFSPSTWPMRDRAPTPHRSRCGTVVRRAWPNRGRRLL